MFHATCMAGSFVPLDRCCEWPLFLSLKAAAADFSFMVVRRVITGRRSVEGGATEYCAGLRSNGEIVDLFASRSYGQDRDGVLFGQARHVVAPQQVVSAAMAEFKRQLL